MSWQQLPPRKRRRRADDRSLIKDEQRTKAAAWAYFASEESSAARLLLESPGRWLLTAGQQQARIHRADRSTDARHRLIGATVATALLKSNRRAGPQEWASVVSGVDDPFIRAVLRRIGGEGWESVLRRFPQLSPG